MIFQKEKTPFFFTLKGLSNKRNRHLKLNGFDFYFDLFNFEWRDTENQQ